MPRPARTFRSEGWTHAGYSANSPGRAGIFRIARTFSMNRRSFSALASHSSKVSFAMAALYPFSGQ